jgi:diguanylate cyclase (GGDEF)-like protein
MPGETRPLVLIVDDDPLFTLLASETLQQAGYAATVADTSERAMAAFLQEKPDLVMLDVELPGSNGFDICAHMRATAGCVDLPIIMVTGHEDTQSMARAFEAGATDFINKPLLWPTLPHRVGFMLRGGDNIRALRVSEQKNRALLQALPDTIYIVDGNGAMLEYITGKDGAKSVALAGKQLGDVVPVEVARLAHRSMALALSNGEGTSYDFELGEGEDQRSFEARVRPQPDGTALIITRDVTERRRTEARIEHLAYYDTLTGLPNRQLFVRETSRALHAEGVERRVALLYLDLNRFKRINDNLGRSVGDMLLQAVARRLNQCIRASDRLRVSADRAKTALQVPVARVGSDEFVISIGDVADDAQALSIANRIQEALNEPFECGVHRFVVTPSIGIALYPRDATDIEDLLVKADIAMYQAKDQNRSGIMIYGESMAVRSLGRLELENDLRRAIEASDFQLYYQPKMNLASGATVGVEALLRWHHATRGWIGPDTFIPLAEESGMIVALGDWVIRETCKQLKLWATRGLGYLAVAVNVSLQQFAREDFVDSVLRTMWQYGIKPQQLELEITESLLMRNVEDTTRALNRLRAAGLTLSIDDFGTGYSSLGYLRQLPVDAVKIDRSFVKDLHTSSDDAAICAAIIAMARELKLKVIAEGVENKEQLNFLREHRCDEAQGYLISQPVSVPDLENLLADGLGITQDFVQQSNPANA